MTFISKHLALISATRRFCLVFWICCNYDKKQNILILKQLLNALTVYLLDCTVCCTLWNKPYLVQYIVTLTISVFARLSRCDCFTHRREQKGHFSLSNPTPPVTVRCMAIQSKLLLFCNSSMIFQFLLNIFYDSRCDNSFQYFSISVLASLEVQPCLSTWLYLADIHYLIPTTCNLFPLILVIS